MLRVERSGTPLLAATGSLELLTDIFVLYEFVDWIIFIGGTKLNIDKILLLV